MNKEKISNFSDIKNELLPFFESSTISKKDLIKKYPESNIEKIISTMISSIKKSDDINKEILGQIMNEIASKTGCKGKNLWQPIRFIITGQEHGPDLASFMSIIGIDECINRFNNVA